MPCSAMRPRRAKAVVNLAPAAAKRRSHMSAWHRPMPAHAPLMAAMTGLGMSRGVPLLAPCRGRPAARRRRAVAADALEHVHVGAGAEAPTGAGDDDDPHVRIGGGTRRAGRSSGSSSSPVQAFRRSGRFRVRRATGSRRSDRTTSSAMARRYRAGPVGCPVEPSSPPSPPPTATRRPPAGVSRRRLGWRFAGDSLADGLSGVDGAVDLVGGSDRPRSASRQVETLVPSTRRAVRPRRLRGRRRRHGHRRGAPRCRSPATAPRPGR